MVLAHVPADMADRNTSRGRSQIAEIEARRRRVADLVRAHCDRTGDSLSSMSLSLGMSRTWLQSWLNSDKPTDMKIHLLRELAQKTGADFEQLMQGGGNNGLEEYLPNVRPAPSVRGAASGARDVPVLGTASCSVQGAMQLQSDSPIEFVSRPVGVATMAQLYAIYVTGDSMSPRFEHGDLVYVAPRPTRRGDYVVVQATDASGNRIAYLKRYIGKTANDAIELEQFNPARKFTVPASDVISIHRALTNADLYLG